MELFDELVVPVANYAVIHGLEDFFEGGSVLERDGNLLVLFVSLG